ncbi:DUF6332 family protein [Streptomyces sp. NPDC002994]|uniref:DUF6332 family protein n=1 Tax=Streptomyces sp. NPDC002994 TaxID=3154441 RepID=UPI0033AE51D2
MDRGRESRWEKDAVTVEIMYALVSGGVLALLIFGAIVTPAFIWHLSRPVSQTLLIVGGCVGAPAGIVRIVHVLRQHGRQRRAGR